MSAGKVISLIGLPGAGKTTLGKALAAHWGPSCKFLGVGEALRERAANDAGLREQLAAGKLGPEEMVLRLVSEEYAACSAEFLILDGFPRHVAQVEFAREHFARWCVLFLDVPRETALQRLTARRSCTKCGAVGPAWEGITECGTCGGREWTTRAEDAGGALERRMEIAEEGLRAMTLRLANSTDVVRLNGTPPMNDVFRLALGAIP